MPIIRTAALKCKYARNTSLPPDEYIVTVGPLGVTGVGHGVEGSGRQGILVHHVEVCAILLLHQLAQGLLMRCADVLVEGRGDARFLYTYISTRISLSIYLSTGICQKNHAFEKLELTLSKVMPSSKVIRSEGLRYWIGSNGNCCETSINSCWKRSRMPSKMKVKRSPITSRTS